MYIKMGVSMELEEVPEKLIEYLCNAEEKLSAKVESVKDGLNSRVIEPKITNELQEIKKELGKFDQTLQDCVEVITSYNTIMLQQKAAYLERQRQPEEEQPISKIHPHEPAKGKTKG